jgi:oligopeptide/dipeptide ABC transporter ATP-binding protein
MKNLVVARGLTTSFEVSGLGWRRKLLYAVDHIDLEIREGEVLALVGESGSGKTTLGRSILRLVEPSAGSVEFDGRELMGMGKQDLRLLRRDMQLIFQDPFASLDPRMTVMQIINEGLSIHRLGTLAERETRVFEMLQLVGLDASLSTRYPHALSGGQRQRVGIARALALRPRFVVADEAVSSLDVSAQAQILRLLADLRQALGLTMLFITHNLNVVKMIADRVCVMYLGKIVETGPTDLVFKNPAHPYTRLLLASVPIPNPLERSNWDLPNFEPPSGLNKPKGCAFHSRCPYAVALCEETTPNLVDAGANRQAACFRLSEIPK